jgi:hypothetical protein
VLEDCTAEEQRSVVYFLWTKGLRAKDIHKEMFPVYCKNCFSHKVVLIWGEKRGRHFADDEELETEVQKWLKQQLEDFYAAGFDALLKRWNKFINVGGGYVEK